MGRVAGDLSSAELSDWEINADIAPVACPSDDDAGGRGWRLVLTTGAAVARIPNWVLRLRSSECRLQRL